MPSKNLILRPPDDTVPHEPVLQELSRCLRALFLYDWPTKSGPVDTEVEAEIHDVLHDRFFSDVFVRRHEAREITEKFQRHTVVVAGERGCGKSTLIARVEQDLTNRSRLGNRTFAVSRIDCNNLAKDTPSIQIFELILHELFGQLLVTTSSNALIFQFWGILLAGRAYDQRLNRLRVAIRTTVKDGLDQSAQWTRAVQGNPRWTADVQEAFDALPVKVRLRELAAALPELKAGGALVLDNIDHLEDHVQVDLLERMVKLNAASVQQLVPLVGIRTENYRRVTARLVGAKIVDSQVLTDSTIIVNHRHEQVVRDYVRKRLSILTPANVPALYRRLDSPDGRAAAKALGFADGRSMFAELMEIANALSGETTPSSRSQRLPKRVLHELNDWCNYSLRDVGLAIANLAYQLLPVVRSRALSQFRHRSWDVRFRELRNLLIRQHVLYDKTLTVREPPHASALLFAQPKEPSAALDFLDYHLLTMVRTHRRGPDDPLKIKEIAAQFAVFGIDAGLIAERIVALAASRDTHDMGLLRVMNDGVLGESEVELLSAGRFTSLYLVRTYEYLFWNAAACHDGTFERILHRVAATCRDALVKPSVSILSRRDGLPTVGSWAWQHEDGRRDICPVPYSVWSNSVLRALVAQQYLREIVRPRYWQMLAGLDQHQTACYRRLFGQPDLPHKIIVYFGKYVTELTNDRSLEADDAALVAELARQRRAMMRRTRSERHG